MLKNRKDNENKTISPTEFMRNINQLIINLPYYAVNYNYEEYEKQSKVFDSNLRDIRILLELIQSSTSSFINLDINIDSLLKENKEFLLETNLLKLETQLNQIISILFCNKEFYYDKNNINYSLKTILRLFELLVMLNRKSLKNEANKSNRSNDINSKSNINTSNNNNNNLNNYSDTTFLEVDSNIASVFYYLSSINIILSLQENTYINNLNIDQIKAFIKTLEKEYCITIDISLLDEEENNNADDSIRKINVKKEKKQLNDLYIKVLHLVKSIYNKIDTIIKLNKTDEYVDIISVVEEELVNDKINIVNRLNYSSEFTLRKLKSFRYLKDKISKNNEIDIFDILYDELLEEYRDLFSLPIKKNQIINAENIISNNTNTNSKNKGMTINTYTNANSDKTRTIKTTRITSKQVDAIFPNKIPVETSAFYLNNNSNINNNDNDKTVMYEHDNYNNYQKNKKSKISASKTVSKRSNFASITKLNLKFLYFLKKIILLIEKDGLSNDNCSVLVSNYFLKILLDSTLFRSYFFKNIEIDRNMLHSKTRDSIPNETCYLLGKKVVEFKATQKLMASESLPLSRLQLPIMNLVEHIKIKLREKRNTDRNFSNLEFEIDDMYLTEFLNKPFNRIKNKVDNTDSLVLLSKENEIILNISFFYIHFSYFPELIEIIYKFIESDKHIRKKIKIEKIIDTTNITNGSINYLTRLAFEFIYTNDIVIHIKILFNNPYIQRLKVLSNICFNNSLIFEKDVNYQCFWLICHWLYERDFIVSSNYCYKYYNNKNKDFPNNKINLTHDVWLIIFLYFLQKTSRIKKLNKYNLDELSFDSFTVQKDFYSKKESELKDIFAKNNIKNDYFSNKPDKKDSFVPTINMKRYCCFDIPNTTYSRYNSSISMQVGQMFVAFIYFLYDMLKTIINKENNEIGKEFYLDVFCDNLIFKENENSSGFSSLTIFDYYFIDYKETVIKNTFREMKNQRSRYDDLKEKGERQLLFTMRESIIKDLIKECERAIHYFVKQDYKVIERIFFKNKKIR